MAAITETKPAFAATIMHLKPDPKWATEKPYYLDYEPPKGALKSNAILDPISEVPIYDIRGREGDFTLKTNGFCLMKFEPGITREDFDNDAKVREIFLKNAANAAKERLGASRVQIFDYAIRKRQSEFPICTGEIYEHLQPSAIAHIDTTEAYAEEVLWKLNPDEAPKIKKHKWHWFNIWKPLRGPLRDYPLIMLDISTVDRARDLEPRDTIQLKEVNETYQIYPNKDHKWYYVSEMMPDEAWLFIQSTSTKGLSLDQLPIGTPHTSVDYPLRSKDDDCRESIECRCFAFFDEED
ncbi:hypothetical protein BX600DRAFT_467794 [Xylariales sp. PMI_506]|nr:hypothetical protein BX600DRAFT_467794 [Xylariales sp. PMI_506]